MSSSPAINSLRNKMQSVRDELEKYRELYEDMCRQHHDEITQRNQVSSTLFYSVFITSASVITPVYCLLVGWFVRSLRSF